MIELDNQTTHIINIDYLEEITSSITDKNIELLIVDNKTIQEINSSHRGVDRATDVLSFPYNEIDIAGSIIISYDKASKVSKELKHSIQDELTLLYIHGLLHCLGYDHESDNGQMRKKEIELIQKFNLPKSLIVRAN